MAVIMKDASYMGFPLSIKRGNPAPVDTTAVWYSKAELENYASSGATAYVGQVLTLVADNKCEAYMISNEAGTLIKLASTTASGDLASDVATLQTQVADLITKVGKAAAGEEQATGLYKEIADVLAIANGKVGSVGATDASVFVGGSATAPTLKVAISQDEGNIITLAEDGLKAVVKDVKVPEYSITKKADAGDYSAVYQLTKDGEAVGADINIPKDMVIKSGTVETYSAGALPTGVTEPGTYIVLVLANATNDKLYIKADGLIEYVTSGSQTGDMVFINIDPSTHKVTATITDGTITKAKLHADVQASLSKADSAIQEILTGSADGTISVDGSDVKVAGLQDAAYATVASLNSTAKGYADEVKEAVVGTEADAADKITIRGSRKYAESQASGALDSAKSYTDTAIANLDVEDSPVAKQFVSAVSEEDGKISVSRRALIADDIPELGISKISGLQSALDGKQDNLVFNTAYDSSTNKVATMTDVANAKDALVGTEEDTKASNTIKGAKLYADDKASSALADAKAYADGLVTGDSGITKRVDALETKVDVDKVSTAIATAKSEAIADAEGKVNSAKTALLGEADYEGTIKGAYEAAAAAKASADSKVTMAEVEAKDYATKAEAQGYADAKDTAIAAAKKAGDDAQSSVDSLSTKVGTVADGKTVVGLINEVKTIADANTTEIGADDTQGTIKNRIKVLENIKAGTRLDSAETRISGLEGQISGVFHFKGAASKNGASLYKDGVEITNAKVGDVYTVGDSEYAWDGTSWVELGTPVDLSNFYTKTEINSKLNGFTGGFHFRGVATQFDAAGKPIISNPQNGDVYLNDKGEQFAWNSTEWVKLGYMTDLSAYSTTSQVESMIEGKLTGLYTFKGTASSLETIVGPARGDVYIVNNTQYAWDGSDWVEIKSTVDLSSYSTTAQMNELINIAKSDAVSVAGQAASTNLNTVKAELQDNIDALKGEGLAEGTTVASIAAKVSEMDTLLSDASTGLDKRVSTNTTNIANLTSKLETIEENAEKNIIESVKVGGAALPVAEDRSVDITSISTDLLTNGANTLILNCGDASI